MQIKHVAILWTEARLNTVRLQKTHAQANDKTEHSKITIAAN